MHYRHVKITEMWRATDTRYPYQVRYLVLYRRILSAHILSREPSIKDYMLTCQPLPGSVYSTGTR